MENNLSKWHILKNQIEVVYNTDKKMNIVTNNQIELFEKKTNLTLPSEYKEYCQVFGSGEFGITLFRIHKPDCFDVESQLISMQDQINACVNYANFTDDQKQLFKSAYVFGQGSDYTFFIFDLKTYNSEDKSANIYGISEDETIYFIGRSFFEFVRDVCIGNKAQECFPDLLLGVHPEDDLQDSIRGRKTFFPC